MPKTCENWLGHVKSYVYWTRQNPKHIQLSFFAYTGQVDDKIEFKCHMIPFQLTLVRVSIIWIIMLGMCIL